jgi:hypothetical protein
VFIGLNSPSSSSPEFSALIGIASLGVKVVEEEDLGLKEIVDRFLGGTYYVFSNLRTIIWWWWLYLVFFLLITPSTSIWFHCLFATT